MLHVLFVSCMFVFMTFLSLCQIVKYIDIKGHNYFSVSLSFMVLHVFCLRLYETIILKVSDFVLAYSPLPPEAHI